MLGFLSKELTTFYGLSCYLFYNRLHIHFRYAERIERSLNVVFLCEVVGCTIIICFLEYGVLQVFKILQTK